MRKTININDNWFFIKGDVSVNNLCKEEAENINIPHTWNRFDGQDGGGDYYKGVGYYYKTLKKINFTDEEVVYLEFKGVYSIADVYLNGKHIFHHEGGFSTFRVRIDESLKEENLLVVKVDNSDNDYIYPQFADFTFFGGIYRDVNMIVTNKTHFDLDYYGSLGVKVTPQLIDNKAEVDVECFVNTDEEIILGLELYDRDNKLINKWLESKLINHFEIDNVSLWNGIENPYIYTLKLAIMKTGNILDNVEIKFGVRDFAVDANKGLILNNKSYPLHGVSRHQDRENMGWAITQKEHLEDINLIKELGANSIRLAHYQHDQYFYDLCDEYGMVVWAEIPFISMFLPKGRNNTISQMKELVIQNYHHPSIFFWGLANEITIDGENKDLLNNLEDLNNLCHEIDKTRITTMAQVTMCKMDSPTNNISDILAYNHYFGWYMGNVEDNASWLDKFHEQYPHRCLGLSEYGCEAVLKWHSSTPKMGDYSEEYQCLYHQKMLDIFQTRPYLWGTYVWNMFDFAADNRDEGGIKGRNNKGLVTYDRKIKKDSFYLYQAYWKEEPMLHIAQKRYKYRCEAETSILVYSNLEEIELFIDDQFIEVKKGKRVFEFKVKLQEGENKIIVKSNGLHDSIIIEKVNQPYQDYILNSSNENITNWFDADGKELNLTFKEDYYSIKDSIKDIIMHKEAKKIVMDFVAGIDIKIPNNLLEMMSSFSIEQIGKLAGKLISPTMIKDINEKLQEIKK